MYNEVEGFLIVSSGQKEKENVRITRLRDLAGCFIFWGGAFLSSFHIIGSLQMKNVLLHMEGNETQGGFVISYCATSVYPSALLGLGETFGLYSNFARGFIKSALVTAANRKPRNQPGGLNAAAVVSPCFSSDVATRTKDKTC